MWCVAIILIDFYFVSEKKMSEKNCKNECKIKMTDAGSEYGFVNEISEDGGRFCTTTYSVFRGIELIYNDAHIMSVETKPTSGSVIEINHCREGRMECHYRDEFCYVAPGDLVIGRAEEKSPTTYFPLSHYHGITVRIDVDRAPGCLSCLLDDVNVRPQAIAEKFCGEKSCFIARSDPSVEHIFSELYSVPEEIKKGYFKIKVLELLLFLSALDIGKDEIENSVYSAAQVDLAKQVSEYLTENMDKRVTLEQIAKHFHVSGTHIKNIFKGVYGVSLYAYTRAIKMESAAYMLEYTDRTVMDIAGEHGYDNSSKFARAFREVKGLTPSEYRAENKK